MEYNAATLAVDVGILVVVGVGHEGAVVSVEVCAIKRRVLMRVRVRIILPMLVRYAGCGSMCLAIWYHIPFLLLRAIGICGRFALCSHRS